MLIPYGRRESDTKTIKIQIVTYKVEYGTFPHLSKNMKRGFWRVMKK